MENENSIGTGDFFEIIGGQLDVLLALLTRPVVLRQLLAIVLILLIAWLLLEGIRRYRRRRGQTADQSDEPNLSHGKRWPGALVRMAAPVAALILFYLTIEIFARLGYPNGLLQDMSIVIWLWLGYRGVQTLLHSRFGDAAQPYQNRIVTPIFVVLIGLQILNALPGASAIADSSIDLGVFRITISRLLAAFLAFYLFAVLAWATKQAMQHSLPNRLDAEPGVIESIATLTRYSILVVGLIVSLGMLGINLTSMAIVAGGLSVGIGIGLQDIVSNFVSGLVLLFERSMRPGDVIELGDRISRVEKISLRATTVRTRSNVELTIPNASFTTGEVKNLTKSVPQMKLIVPFGVDYSSDLGKVRQLAVDIALQHPLTLAFPAPALIVRGYGESSLDLNLTVSINRPELSVTIKSDLYIALWKAFSEHNIELPNPQRDLNLGDGWEKVSSAPHTNWPLGQVDELATNEPKEE